MNMMFFNVHNIFKFALEGEISEKIKKYFHNELGCFETKGRTPDLKVRLVSHIPDPRVNFYPNSGRDNKYFYTRDQYSRKVGIFSNSEVIAESEVLGSFLLEDIIEPLALIHFLKKGYTFLHASAVSNNGQALVFSAFPKTGKTNAALSLIKSGYDFLSNELIIVSDRGEVFSYPRPLALYPYNLEAFPEIIDIVANKKFLKKKEIEFFILLSKIQNIYIFKYPNSLITRVFQLAVREIIGRNYPLSPDKIGAKTESVARLDKLFLLLRDRSLKKPELREIKDKKLLAGQLWSDILREKNKFLIKISLTANFAFPEKGIGLNDKDLRRGEVIIFNALKKIRCFQIRIPEKAHPKEILSLIDLKFMIK